MKDIALIFHKTNIVRHRFLFRQELWPLTKLIQIGDLLYTCKKLACLISPRYRRIQNSV